MQERIDLVTEQKTQTAGFSIAVASSVVFHSFLIYLFLTSYHPMPKQADVPIARYVQLMKQNPQEFVEAPGPAVDKAPINAPFSDANRRASGPKPTGDVPTRRPGEDGGMYSPPIGERSDVRQQKTAGAQAPQMAQVQPPEPVELTPSAGSTRIPPLRSQTANTAASVVDWRSVIRDVKQVASIGGGGGEQGVDLGNPGGEKGTFETGPLSFETQWYDWGPYAQSMVSKIRVQWYAVMPQLIRTGMRGVVTIRFTIQRDGRMTDIEMLASSTVPPYDFAAKKAIELASPLNPLPADFPLGSERVTAMFYYNQDPPKR